MTLDRILISQRAINSQYEEGKFFKYLPWLFDYLLNKLENDRFTGCEDIRLAVTDSFDRDTRTLLANEDVIIFDIRLAHDCDEIIKAYFCENSSDLTTFNDYVLSTIEKYLYNIGVYQHALWVHMCRRSLFFDYKHNYQLRRNMLPRVPPPTDIDVVELKLKALILTHEIRHHFIINDKRAKKFNSMLRSWIEIVQYEYFPDLQESQFIEIVEDAAEELICDYVSVSLWEDFDWDLQIKSGTSGMDFCVAMFSLALHLEITAQLNFEIDDIRSLSLRLRSAVLRRSTHPIVGKELYQIMCQKYEYLYKQASNMISDVLKIRKFNPPNEITEFSRPDLALEYFNGYDRDSDEEWSKFIDSDMESWYDKVSTYRRLNDAPEFGLIDKICRDTLPQPWLAPTVKRLFESRNRS
jgi:hypothetical protein